VIADSVVGLRGLSKPPGPAAGETRAEQKPGQRDRTAFFSSFLSRPISAFWRFIVFNSADPVAVSPRYEGCAAIFLISG
jgi:hypothetical protein